MWKVTNGIGQECVWYSKEEVQEMFSDIKNICENALFQTNEANQLKNEILRIINECEGINEVEDAKSNN